MADSNSITKTAIIIAGPTAAGKTSLAIALATALQTEIISADSRQCYREMNIGVAKPCVAELEAVHHYFINSHSIHEPVNAADYELYALDALARIFTTKDTAVVVGGTGLYIKALCEGMDPIPPVDATLREQLYNDYKHQGIAWLQEQVKSLDPLFYASGEIGNPHRLLRALEVIKTTGKSIREYQTQKKAIRDFRILKFALTPPKEQLQHNINQRVDQMMEAGLVDEVRSLLPYRDTPPLQTVGYSELFQYLDGAISLAQATEAIKIHTRQYAKRQLTWFRKDKEFTWVDNSNELFNQLRQTISI
jgi:tRNA dimethylallyltransferase